MDKEKKERKKEKHTDGDRIELRIEEFQEVLGGVPPWILRVGIILIAGIVVVILNRHK